MNKLMRMKDQIQNNYKNKLMRMNQSIKNNYKNKLIRKKEQKTNKKMKMKVKKFKKMFKWTWALITSRKMHHQENSKRKEMIKNDKKQSTDQNCEMKNK